MGVDRRMWKMSPERLQEHLQLKNRARQIPDKKKQQNKRACRDNSRRASRISGVAVSGSLVSFSPKPFGMSTWLVLQTRLQTRQTCQNFRV